MPLPSQLACLSLTAVLLGGAALAQGAPAPQPSARRPQEGTTCVAFARKLGRNLHVIDDEKHWAEWRAEGCEVEVRFEGRLRFNEDFTALTGLERRGRFEVEEDGPVDRELEVRQEEDGLRFTYTVEGRRRELDVEGRAWLESVLLQLFRNTGYAAQERSAWLLRRSGPEGLLAELEQMESGHAQQVYVAVLLSSDAAARMLARVLHLARSWESDHAKAGVLEAAATRLGGDAAARREAWAVARTLESDHYAATSVNHLLGAGRLQADELEAALTMVGGMDSDHYRAQVLKALADEPAMQGPQVARFLRLTGGIDSDHYRSEALTALTVRERLEGAALVEAIRVASRIESDHYRASTLVQIAHRHALQGEARDAYRRAAGSIESEHYRNEALAALH